MPNATTRGHVDEPSSIQRIPVVNLADRQTSTSDDSDVNDAIVVTVPTSRKEKRKLKKAKLDSALPTPPDTDEETSSKSRKPPSKPPKKQHKNTTDNSTDIPPSMPFTKNAYPLLICSIGNPGATYANTLHSAGHIMTSYLSERKTYTPFRKGLSGLISKPDNTRTSFSLTKGLRKVEHETQLPGEDWTFWQSTSLMNISGANVRRAYQEWQRTVGSEGRLVIIHDELESALGYVTIRDGASSAKGHNGLKSCQQQLGSAKWWRIGLGIGRPESRDPSVVSKYVLGKMSGKQREALEGSAIHVFAALEAIAAGKR